MRIFKVKLMLICKRKCRTVLRKVSLGPEILMWLLCARCLMFLDLGSCVRESPLFYFLPVPSGRLLFPLAGQLREGWKRKGVSKTWWQKERAVCTAMGWCTSFIWRCKSSWLPRFGKTNRTEPHLWRIVRSGLCSKCAGWTKQSTYPWKCSVADDNCT
jgi:hypothetical protein